MHQQLTHVAIALAHPDIDLAQHMVDLLRVAAGDRVAHQLDLDLQESQRLGDRVVQFTR